MPALAPIITQTAPTDQPVTAGAVVATLATDPGETDPGPFTYGVVTGAANFAVSGTDLMAAVDLTGANDVGVTVTGSDATASPETLATLTFGEVVPPSDWESDDGYEDNPCFPPVPADPAEQGYQYFLVQATNMVVPHARPDVDFVYARADKYSDITNLWWNDAVLGPRPDAEIEALARELAANAPQLAAPPVRK